MGDIYDLETLECSVWDVKAEAQSQRGSWWTNMKSHVQIHALNTKIQVPLNANFEQWIGYSDETYSLICVNFLLAPLYDHYDDPWVLLVFDLVRPVALVLRTAGTTGQEGQGGQGQASHRTGENERQEIPEIMHWLVSS